MKIAVTGSNGFIGGELVNYLSSKHHVIALQRNIAQKQAGKIEYRKFDLTDESTFNAITGADVLIHCAFIRFDKGNKNAFEQNVEGTTRLAEMCKQQSILFIFFSTMSAHMDALSQYGQHKFEIEKRLDTSASTILKLGLVIGSSGGLFNSIKGIISKSSLIPLVDGGNQPIQIIHISDLCKLILKVSEQRITGTFNIGTSKVYTLKYLYEQIAASLSKQIKFISLPFGFMKTILSITEKIGLNLPVTSENLMGLKQLKAFETENDLNKLGIELISLKEAVRLS